MGREVGRIWVELKVHDKKYCLKKIVKMFVFSDRVTGILN